jgi:acyl-CoA thioesterase-1
LAALALLAAFGAYRALAESPAETRIVAFGDSLTYGVGSARGGGFVSFLEDALGRPIENMGAPGDTTRDALGRLDAVIAREPDAVIVLLGGNDLLKGIPASETAKNLALISARLKNAGAKVLLLKLDLLKDIWGKPELMSDDVHPNDKGYLIMAQRIEPDLRKLVR